MLSGEMFDCVEHETRKIRDPRPEAKGGGRGEGCDPFGGIQLILCGDFSQLPPIETTDLSHMSKKLLDTCDGAPLRIFLNRGFAFQAQAWAACQIHTVQLSTIHRQAGASRKLFINALSEIRKGFPALNTKKLRQTCNRSLACGDGIEPTILYCRNFEVDKVNAEKLACVYEEMKKFTGSDLVEVDHHIENDPVAASTVLANTHA